MGETAALAYRFARASLARDMEASDPLRDEIVRRWGDKALVAISLGHGGVADVSDAEVRPGLRQGLLAGDGGRRAPSRRWPLAA